MRKYFTKSKFYLWTIVAVISCFGAYKICGYTDDDDGHLDFNKFNTTRNYPINSLTAYKKARVIPIARGRPGENGTAVKIPNELRNVANSRFREHSFNIVASDMISENRSLADNRHDKCKKIKYPSALPTASVIIVFHNEAWSTLIRTIWSVINRTPRELIKEIILVDDASEKDYLREQLDRYVERLPIKCFVLRQSERLGLIQARLLGSSHATGLVLTFLDAHCECLDQWLEPLLARIAHNRYIVPAPIIDVISDETFGYYETSPGDWGGFDWKFNFKWVKVPERELKRIKYSPTSPVRPSTMAGGLFAIDRAFFYELGAYDEGMLIWGAENLEMSFRIWMCGGILEMVPCSRVGHVFRRISPYTFPGGEANVVHFNTDRLVNVWADEWSTFYYKASRRRRDDSRINDVSKRLALRERLQCKSFKWYLENIFPEYRFPLDNYFYMGQIINADTKQCLELTSVTDVRLPTYIPFTLNSCHKFGGNQMFVYTREFQLIANGICIDAVQATGRVNASICSDESEHQIWFYNDDNQTVVHVSTGSCLTKPIAEKTDALLKVCDGSLGQRWIMDGFTYVRDEL